MGKHTTPVIGVIQDSVVGKGFELHGAEVVDIYTPGDLDIALKYVDAIVLTGGSDVDPKRYGQKRHSETYGLDTWRDKLEFRAVELAHKRKLPIMGICRGMQLINVALGGTLNQHIGNHHWGASHPILLKAGSELRSLNDGEQRVPKATHMHHQAVAKLGRGMMVAARSKDGTIEAIESSSSSGLPYTLGVQFHPEYDIGEKIADGIFKHFISKAARKAKGKAAATKRVKLYEDKTYKPYLKPLVRRTGTTTVKVKEPWNGAGFSSYEYDGYYAANPKRDPLMDKLDDDIDEEFFRRGMSTVSYDDENDIYCEVSPCVDPWKCDPAVGHCIGAEVEANASSAIVRYEHDEFFGRKEG